MYNVDTIEWFRTSFKIDNSYFLNQNFLGKAIWILQSNLSKMTDLSFVENVNDELLDQVTIIPITRRLLTIRLLWRRAGQSQGKSLSLSFGWCCVSDLITRGGLRWVLRCFECEARRENQSDELWLTIFRSKRTHQSTQLDSTECKWHFWRKKPHPT